jgi:hypothetical protein
MVLALATTVVTYISNISFVQVPFAYMTVEREKAKMLALSGIQVAVALLSQEVDVAQSPKNSADKQSQPPQAAQKKQEPSEQEKAAKEFIQKIVPHLNRWQTFELNEKVDGVDGAIKLCITSEQGKIDLNAWYDFETHSFKGDKAHQQALKSLILAAFKGLGGEDLYAEFEKFLKARQYRLDDITELLRIPGFIAWREYVFYPGPITKEKEQEKNKTPVYLTDIFTVWSGTQTIDPWLLSNSMCGLVGVKQAQSKDVENRKKAVEQVIKDVTLEAQWATDWKKYLSPLYGAELNSLAKGVELIFGTRFEPKVFSVLSYGVVGNVTQRALAILERVEEKTDRKLSYAVTIKKLYWL